MPVELYLPAPGRIDFRPVSLPSPGPGQVRIQTHLTGIRHGSDLLYFAGGPDAVSVGYPWTPETWGVGDVIEVGNRVSRLAVGDRVHGPMRHQDQIVGSQERYSPLEWLREEFAVFIDPGVTALRCIRQSGIRYGDRVAVFGLGTVGLMALQFASLSGALEILALDPLPSRVRVAQRLGAHEAIPLSPPYDQTLDRHSRNVTNLDAAFDFSGNEEALWLAASTLRRGGTLVTCAAAYRKSTLSSLQEMCQEEAIRLVWVKEEKPDPLLERLVFDSLSSKRVIVWPIHSHTFSFADAPYAYECIRQEPDVHIKVLLRYQ